MNNKTPQGIRLPKEVVERIDQLANKSNPKLTKASIIEYCLNKSLPDLEKQYHIKENK